MTETIADMSTMTQEGIDQLRKDADKREQELASMVPLSREDAGAARSFRLYKLANKIDYLVDHQPEEGGDLGEPTKEEAENDAAWAWARGVGKCICDYGCTHVIQCGLTDTCDFPGVHRFRVNGQRIECSQCDRGHTAPAEVDPADVRATAAESAGETLVGMLAEVRDRLSAHARANLSHSKYQNSPRYSDSTPVSYFSGTSRTLDVCYGIVCQVIAAIEEPSE